MSDAPRFKHDCVQCVLLGTAEQFVGPRAGAYDLYFCPQPSLGPTLVARYGDDGRDYDSWNLKVIEAVIGNPDYELRNVFHFALSAARERGLCP